MIRMCNIIKENNEMKLNIVDTFNYVSDDTFEVMKYIIEKFSIDKCIVENFFMVATDNNHQDYYCMFIGIGDWKELIFEISYVFNLIYITDKREFLVCHNHPNKIEACPSEVDIETYKSLNLFAKASNSNFIDSYIVTSSDIAGISEFVD